MFDNDLFVDDDNVENQLDFLKQSRNQRSTQPYQQNKIEQDLRVENEDEDDFNHQFKSNKRGKEEEPQKLDDLWNQNDDQNGQPEFLNNNVSRLSKGIRAAPNRLAQSRAGQNVNTLLYDNNASNTNATDDAYSNLGDTPKSIQFSVVNSDFNDLSNSTSRPVTGNRPGTSTTMNARVKLAAQQKARLQAQNSTSSQGTMVANGMLRASKVGANIYEGSTYDYGRSSTGMIYDPSNKFMDNNSGLPTLSKINHVISYKADEVAPTSGANVKASNVVDHQEAQEAEKVESPREDAYKPLKENFASPEEEKSIAPSEMDRDVSSDEEPTKEDMKMLEKQKKEMNKQQDAEIGLASPTDMQQQGDMIPRPLHLDIRDIPDMKTFLMSPCPKGYRLECTIKRDKSGLSRFYPKYHCYLSNGGYQYLMSGKKRAQNKTSNYLLSYNKNEIKKNSPYCLGKVRSNFMGTEFNLFDQGLNPGKSTDIEKLRANLGVVLYESNLLSAKGPRKMKILLPEVGEQMNDVYQFKPLTEKEGILSNWKCGKKNGIREYQNKNPKWNEQLQAFVLNFNGRVEKPSVKNFQLIDERNDERIYLQFGRVTNDTFNMDIEWPLSPFQAFAICLSSFDYKIACE